MPPAATLPVVVPCPWMRATQSRRSGSGSGAQRCRALRASCSGLSSGRDGLLLAASVLASLRQLSRASPRTVVQALRARWGGALASVCVTGLAANTGVAASASAASHRPWGANERGAIRAFMQSPLG